MFGIFKKRKKSKVNEITKEEMFSTVIKPHGNATVESHGNLNPDSLKTRIEGQKISRALKDISESKAIKMVAKHLDITEDDAIFMLHYNIKRFGEILCEIILKEDE